MTLQKTKKVGRPQKCDVDLLRSRVWYYAVKQRQNLSDYKMDLLVMDRLGLSLDHPSQRIRIFERLRAKGSFPSSGMHPRRNFDLIQVVNEIDGFKGTAQIFHSPYWQLLSSGKNDIVICNSLLHSAIVNLGPELIGLTNEQEAVDKYINELIKCAALYDSSSFIINSTFYKAFDVPKMDCSSQSLQRLALFGALFKKAYLECELLSALKFKTLFFNKTNEYAMQSWMFSISSSFVETSHKNVFTPI